MFGINKDEVKVKRFIIMGKFKNQDKFILEKQFVNRHSAEHYAKLMTEHPDYDEYEYFLFEQSQAFNEGNDND